MGKDDQKEKQGCNDDNEDDIVCCKHGRPCPKASEKRKKKKQTEEENSSIYENMQPAINEEAPAINKEASMGNTTEASKSNYEIVPDGGLGADEPTGEEDNEGISTAKEHDDEDYEPIVFQRTDQQNQVVNGLRTSASSNSSYTDITDRVNPREKDMIKLYIGICTKRMAEQQCNRSGGFLIYHQVNYDKDVLQNMLPLFIVYRASKPSRDYRHIRVLRSERMLHVDIEGEPKFDSLSSLITFYEIYASFNNNFEAFPNKTKSCCSLQAQATGDD